LRTLVVISCAAAMFGATGANAHHSEAGYNADAIVAFEGTVTRYGWRNPHVYINVETVDAAGNRVEWLVETGATPIMVRSGWSPESLAPGDKVSVRGHPDKQAGRPRAILLSMTKADGTVLAQVDGTPEQPNASTTNLAGVWRGIPATIGSFAAALDAVPPTAAGAAARASYDFLTDPRAANCIAPQAPNIIMATVLYLSEIELGDDAVLIKSEFFDAVRTVYTDGRGHPENGPLTNQGHSIGHWEDGTLVVDTVQFAEQQSSNGQGIPSSPQKHMVERYSLSDDGTRMLVDVMLEDPVYLAEPFHGQLEWQYSPNLRLQRYNCDPEISRVFTQ
jgi:hypothetical protein